MAQALTLHRSIFNVIAASRGSFTIIYKLVSSANSLIEELIFSTISFIYIKKSKGPSIEPCGTPALIYAQEEVAPGRTAASYLLNSQ